MNQPRSEFGVLIKSLLEDLERTRRAWSKDESEEGIKTQIQKRICARLPELLQEFFPDDLQISNQINLYQREMEQLFIPRYARIAKEQNQVENLSTKPWQGNDLYNRIFYAGFFVLVGIFVVWAPFIPLWDKSIPFFLGAVAFFISPFLPNLYQNFLQKQHKRKLAELFTDLDQAGLALPSHETSNPLS